ncbi:hypothetical protein QFC22_002753 [Naganishia vaughanmartiniae]|uniref:Uncharacterized protein n=1 Tax=Naganishia vaughanmartiniae TaxID=1424756 RepID=A0ACC2X9W6_9TREE|nr:hypothetical protein QFC22_002753 [Naganishia vaughanmartiniae]
MASANQRLSAILPSWSGSPFPPSHHQALHIDVVYSNQTATPASSSSDRKKVRFVALSPFGSKCHDQRRQSNQQPARSESDISSSPGSESFDTDQQSSEPTTSSVLSLAEFEVSPSTRSQDEWKVVNQRRQEVAIAQSDAGCEFSSPTTLQASLNMASNPASPYDSDNPLGLRPNHGVPPEREQEVTEVVYTDDGTVMRHLVPVLRYGAPLTRQSGVTAFAIEEHAAGAMVSPSSSSSSGVDNGLSMRERLTRNTRRMLHNVGHTPARPRRSSQRPVTADATLQRAYVATIPETGENTPRPPTIHPPSPPAHPVTSSERGTGISPPLAPQLQANSGISLPLPVSPLDLQHSGQGSRRGSSPLSDASSKWTYGNVPSREDLLSLSSFVSDGDAHHTTPTLEYLAHHLREPPRGESAVSPVATGVAAAHPANEAAKTSSLPGSAIESTGSAAVDTFKVKKGFAFFGGGSISRKKGEGFINQQSSTNPDDQHIHVQDSSTSGEATPRRKLSHFRSKPSTSDGVASVFDTRKSSAASSSRDEGIQRSHRIDSNDDASYAPISRASVASGSSQRQRLPFGSLSSAGTGSLHSWTHNPLVTTATRSTQRGSDAHEDVLTPKSMYSPSPLPEEPGEPFDNSPFQSAQPGMASVASSSQEGLLDARYNVQLDEGSDQELHGTPSGKEALPASVTGATMSTASQYPSFHSFPSDAPLVQPGNPVDTSLYPLPLDPSAAEKLVTAAQQFKRAVTRGKKDKYAVAMPESYLNYDPNPDPDGIIGILDGTPKTESSAGTPNYPEIPLAPRPPIDYRAAPVSIHQLIEPAQPSAASGNTKRSDLFHKLIHKRSPPVGLGIIIPPDPQDTTSASGKTAPAVHTTMQAKIQVPMDRIMDRKSKENKIQAKDSLRKQKETILEEVAKRRSREEGQLQKQSPSTSLRRSDSVDHGMVLHGLRTFKDSGSASPSPRRSRPQTAPTSTDSYYVQHPDILSSSNSPTESPAIPTDSPKRRGLIRRMFSKEGLIRQFGFDRFSKSKGNGTQSSLISVEDANESYEAQEARLLATAEEMATPVRESFNYHFAQQRASTGEQFTSQSTSAASMIPLSSKTVPTSSQSMFTAESDITRDDSFAAPSPARSSSDIAGQDKSPVSSSVPKRISYEGSRILAPSPKSPTRPLSRTLSSPGKNREGRLPATPTKRRPGEVLPFMERPIDTITEEGTSRLAAINRPELNPYSSDTITRVLSGGKRDLHKTVIAEDSGDSSGDSSSSGAKEIALLQERLLRAQARREERRRQKEALRARLAIEEEDDHKMRDPNLKPCEKCGCVCASTFKRRDKGKQKEV